jgi:hypothetical protein
MMQLLDIIQHRIRKSVALYLCFNAESILYSPHTSTDQCNKENVSEIGFFQN